MEEDDEYRMIMPFLDQGKSFARGFECGQIWELLKSKSKIEKHTFHNGSKAQVKMMCDRFICVYEIEKLDDEWYTITVKAYNQN